VLDIADLETPLEIDIVPDTSLLELMPLNECTAGLDITDCERPLVVIEVASDEPKEEADAMLPEGALLTDTENALEIPFETDDIPDVLPAVEIDAPLFGKVPVNETATLLEGGA